MVRVLIEEMEQYASQYNVPIMMKDGISFMLDYIKEHNITRILEIGSAIGYSAIRMASIDSNIHVTTIERDEVRYQEAVSNIRKAHMEDQITIILGDAFDVNVEGEYDLIFIDAAKSQYIKFFEKFEVNLALNGTILSDNLDFHGLTHTTEKIESRNVRGLVRKLNQYIDFLKNHPRFETTFYSVGDGIGVSVRK